MSGGILFFAITVTAFGMLFFAGREKKKREREGRAVLREREFGENPFNRAGAEQSRGLLSEIAIYYEERKHLFSAQQVDEVTWSDLEMDEVFLRVNHTRSYIGEQVLYAGLHDVERLRDKGQTGEVNAAQAMEKRIVFFTEHAAERDVLEEELWRIGKTREDYYLPMFLGSADSLLAEHLWIYRVLQTVLVGSLMGIILLQNTVCAVVFTATVLVNLGIYAVSREKYEVYLHALGSVSQLIHFSKKIAEGETWKSVFDTESVKRAVDDLEQLRRVIGRFWEKRARSLTGDAMDILRDYLIGATLWDITAFWHIMTLIDGKQKQLFFLYEFTGGIDMEIAVASFRKSLPGYCAPQLGEEIPFCVEQVYHPLLNHPVRNDFMPERNCIITGANASGKSTFLKAVAVNAILAQTIYTCAAKRFAMSGAQVITSMAVRDDLLSGESYYIREAGYLKRIVDAVGNGQWVLCLIDEILRGTNTKERLAASGAVCEYLAGRNCLAIIATHDMELAEHLKSSYEGYYFGSEIRNKNIFFDYQIHRGIGNQSNAIQILAYMDFPPEIVERAMALQKAAAANYSLRGDPGRNKQR